MLIIDGLCLLFIFFSSCVSFQVFKNLKLFMENKQPGDELFDRLNVSNSLNSLRTFIDSK